MNIQRQLERIHKELSEIAFEMEIGASKPKERKGAYHVSIYYHDEDREIFGSLLTKPKLDRKSGAWVADFEIEDEYFNILDYDDVYYSRPKNYFADKYPENENVITAYWEEGRWNLYSRNR